MKFTYEMLLLSLIIPLTHASVSSGPYIGLEIGEANQIINFNSSSFDTSGNSINNSNWGILGRLNIGYNASKYSGFELSYNYSALPTYSFPGTNNSFSGNVSAIDFSYILYIPTVIQKFSVFGRLGIGYDWINSNSSSNTAASPTGSNFTDVLGTGIKYNISPKVSFRLEWIENGLLFPINLGGNATYNTQIFMLGFNYHF